MSAPAVAVGSPPCPHWCDRQHIELEAGDTLASHIGTVKEPIGGTDRYAAVWIATYNGSAPRLLIDLDRAALDGLIRCYESLPAAGLEAAEAAALTIALQKAMAAITPAVAS